MCQQQQLDDTMAAAQPVPVHAMSDQDAQAADVPAKAVDDANDQTRVVMPVVWDTSVQLQSSTVTAGLHLLGTAAGPAIPPGLAEGLKILPRLHLLPCFLSI